MKDIQLLQFTEQKKIYMARGRHWNRRSYRCIVVPFLPFFDFRFLFFFVNDNFKFFLQKKKKHITKT